MAVAVRRSKRQVAHAPCRAKKPKRAVRFTTSHCGVLCMRAREYVRVAGGPGPGAGQSKTPELARRAAAEKKEKPKGLLYVLKRPVHPIQTGRIFRDRCDVM